MNSSKNKLILRYPASWWGNMWREALPSGNGKIGAAVYGGVKEETILIDHEDLWHAGKKDELPDVSYTLAEARKLMDDGQYKDAGWLLTNALKEKGYSSSLAKILPLADLRVSMSNTNAFTKYRRILDMETGEVSVQWLDGTTRFKRNLFVSRADDLIVYEITGEGGLVNCQFQLTVHDIDNSKSAPRAKELGEVMKVKTESNYIYYSCKNDDNTDFGAVLRVIPQGGTTSEDEKSITIKDAEKVLVLIKVFVKSECDKEWDSLRNQLSAINKGYDEMLASHAEIHKKLFNTAAFELENDNKEDKSNEELLLEAYEGESSKTLVQKMWAYGRYLFISASREKGNPCGMYGLWGGDYKLMWCHNMANENLQMIHWHTMVGGLSEIATGMFDYYDSLLDDFRNNAKKLFGCRGIYVPAGSTPGIGVPNQIVPVIMNWTSAAGWLARHYVEYYQYTGDIEFLRNRALPFMKEIALFYKDFITIGEDGEYKYYPSVSPENTPSNYYPKEPMAHPMPTTINSTMDIAVMKEVLTNLIDGSKIAGVYEEEISEWEEMLKHIPAYGVNDEGAMREWIHKDFDDNYNHRHLSHIYPLFPGQEINKENNPKLFRALDIAVEKRMLGAQTGWSMTHMASIYARLGYGDKALECLENLSRSTLLNNFYTLHNDWRNMGLSMNIQSAPIQMDANMGWVNAVQEMLFYSSPNLVRILPACPTKWTNGKVKEFRFCTGKTSFNWDINKNHFEAEIKADRITEMILVLPEMFNSYVLTGDGIEVTKVNGSEYKYNVSMIPNGILRIESK